MFLAKHGLEQMKNGENANILIYAKKTENNHKRKK